MIIIAIRPIGTEVLKQKIWQVKQLLQLIKNHLMFSPFFNTSFYFCISPSPSKHKW
ncbi:hypothetical protein pb186bvf_018198 [Paramecium bursaria]